jgi:hypothetical protein
VVLRSAVLASLIVLLNNCASGKKPGPVEPPVDTTVPTLGAHTVAFKRDGASSASVVTPGITTNAAGSVMLVCVGRGVVAAHAAPADNKSNTYAQLGTTHTYTRFPNSGTACYAATNSSGGAAHSITTPASAGAPFDETTVAVVEIANGARVQDVRWNEALAAPLTSQSVTTTGPATLVAVWFGDGGVDVMHVATPNNGFTVVESVLATGALVQVAVATRQVTAAGTYNVTWTSTEGAQLWLFAVRK